MFFVLTAVSGCAFLLTGYEIKNVEISNDVENIDVNAIHYYQFGVTTLSNYNGQNGQVSTQCGYVDIYFDGQWYDLAQGEIFIYNNAEVCMLQAVAYEGWQFAGWVLCSNTESPPNWPSASDWLTQENTIMFDGTYPNIDYGYFYAYYIPSEVSVNVYILETNEDVTSLLAASNDINVTVSYYNANGAKLTKDVNNGTRISHLIGSTFTISDVNNGYIFAITSTQPTLSSLNTLNISSSFSSLIGFPNYNLYVVIVPSPTLRIKTDIAVTNNINLSIGNNEYTFITNSLRTISVNGDGTFYLRKNNKPTLSTYDGVNQIDIDWNGQKCGSITIYIYQRYSIILNGNGNTDGKSPQTIYKIYGTSVKLNTYFTRTGYKFSSWNGNQSGTSSTNYSYNASYSNNSNITLYAIWEANNYEVSFNSNGGDDLTKITVVYEAYYGELLTPKRVGYNFIGWYLNSSFTGNQITATTKVTTASNHTLYAKWEAKNPARYDSEKGYWYVEMGMYPQTRATQTEINGITSTNGAVYTINGIDVISKVGANSIEYCQYSGAWYKVEPVRYVLAGDYSAGNGYENTNVLAIMEQVVYISEWNEEDLGIDARYVYTYSSSSADYAKNSTLYKNLNNIFWGDSGLSEYKDNYKYIGTRTDFYVKNFNSINGSNTSGNISFGITFVPTSTKDLDTVFGSGNYEAEFSDLVSDILGNNLMYWTRDVGSNLNNAECITRLGTVTQAKMQKMLGVRLTVNVKTFGCE